MYDYIRYNSPLGMLTVAAENGALTALVIEGQKYAERHLAGEGRECETPVLRRARCWLDDYFAGKKPDASAVTWPAERLHRKLLVRQVCWPITMTLRLHHWAGKLLLPQKCLESNYGI